MDAKTTFYFLHTAIVVVSWLNIAVLVCSITLFSLQKAEHTRQIKVSIRKEQTDEIKGKTKRLPMSSNKTEKLADAGDTASAAVASDSKINHASAREYWTGVDADDNGMLGGYGHVSRVDLRGSRSFLAKLGLGRKNGTKSIGRVLEGGAGYVVL